MVERVAAVMDAPAVRAGALQQRRLDRVHDHLGHQHVGCQCDRIERQRVVGPQAERFRGAGESVDASLDYCSSCGMCTLACPQGVHVAEINSQARAVMKQQHGMPLRDQLISRPPLQGKLGTPVAPLANLVLSNRLARLVAEKTIGIHRHAAVPKFAGRTFRSWARRQPPPATSGTRRVAYFHGCSTNYFEPALGRMTVAVLEHNGFRVIVPPQGCCGLPLQSNGIFKAGRGYVRRLVAHLVPYARRGDVIVATSTSCGLMLKREAIEILGVQDEDLRVVSTQTYDICEFLAELQEA